MTEQIRTTDQMLREFQRVLATPPTRIPVHALRPGDVLSGTGETVVSVSAGIRTPRQKMDVVLDKANRRRTTVWGRHTLVNIETRK